MYPFRNKDSFYGEELSAPRPVPKLEDHPLLAIPDCFNIFAATLHIGRHSSIRNLRTRHAVEPRLCLRDLLLAQLWTVNPFCGTLYLMSAKSTIVIPLVQPDCSDCTIVMCVRIGPWLMLCFGRSSDQNIEEEPYTTRNASH